MYLFIFGNQNDIIFGNACSQRQNNSICCKRHNIYMKMCRTKTKGKWEFKIPTKEGHMCAFLFLCVGVYVGRSQSIDELISLTTTSINLL